jgi:hypothetical protein
VIPSSRNEAAHWLHKPCSPTTQTVSTSGCVVGCRPQAQHRVIGLCFE